LQGAFNKGRFQNGAVTCPAASPDWAASALASGMAPGTAATPPPGPLRRDSIGHMGFGNLTKQLAQEAIQNSVGDVLDSLRPHDASQISEKLASEKSGAQGSGESVGSTIVRQVQAMQTALKEDEELMVLFHNGLETLRVLDFFSPSQQVIVLAGIDTQKNVTRVISPAETLQLTCKVMKVPLPAKPVRLRFIAPKPKA
jgi:hypothetical protein